MSQPTNFQPLLDAYPILPGESSKQYARRVFDAAAELIFEYKSPEALASSLKKKGLFTQRIKTGETLIRGEIHTERFRLQDDEDIPLEGMQVRSLTTNPYGKAWVRMVPNSHNQDEVLANLQEKFKGFKPPVFKPLKVSRKRNIGILNMYDAHLDKIAVRASTGTENTLDGNIRVFKDSFTALLNQVNTLGVERIVFPIGHDLFHTNDYNGRTKKGTPIEYLCQPNEAYEQICETMVWCVSLAVSVCPVYVPFIKGNHDEDKVHTLGFWMNQVFGRSKHFSCDNTRLQRKYLRYGQNLFGFAHGDKEKSMIDKLPLLMAEERKEDWALTRYRKFYCGDLHHNFEFKFMKSKDFTGCNVEFLRSVGGNDAWHSDFGWVGIPKTAEASIWNHDSGNISDIKLNIV